MARRKSASETSPLDQAANLLAESSPAVRAETAAIIGTEFASGELSARERKIAGRILEIMARDVEIRVREALSEQVKSCPFLPRDLAITLADDIVTVALPILQFSSVFNDADLMAVIDAGNAAKQMAIAKRSTISTTVSDRLVDTDNIQVVGELLANTGAEISEKSYGKAMNRFSENDRIQGLMVARPTLPLAIVERLVTCVSVELRERIMSRHDFPAALAEEIVARGREGALTRSLSSEHRASEVQGLVARLRSKGELTPTLILRSICEGDVLFFESAIAVLAGVSINKARPFLYERGAGGLRMIYRNTALPPEMFRAMSAAVEEVNRSREEQPNAWRQVFTSRIVERLAEEYDGVAPTSLEHVLSEISRRVLGRWEEPPSMEQLFQDEQP
jgi:uncharacterized protein (DUF2336 family)